MISDDSIKRIFKEELCRISTKYSLDQDGYERIIKTFNSMYDKNCEGIKEYYIYDELTKTNKIQEG